MSFSDTYFPALPVNTSATKNGCDKNLWIFLARKIQRFLSQPFFVAEVFTGSAGKYVSLKDTIKGFKSIIDGEYDHLPEQAFYMIGSIEEAEERAKAFALSSASSILPII